MQYAQDKVKKMRGTKRAKSKGASKRAKSSTATASFKAAVAKEVVKQKAKDMGYIDAPAGSTTSDQADFVFDGAASGGLVVLPIPAQGAAETERVGKKMLWHACALRGHLASKSATVTCRGFWAIIYDKEPQGSAPSFNSIFLVAGTQGSSASTFAMLNPETSTRYSVVARRDFEVTAQGSDNASIPIEEWIDLKKRECVFKSAGGAIGDVQKGALYLVWGSNLSGTAAYSFQVNRRMRFIDV